MRLKDAWILGLVPVIAYARPAFAEPVIRVPTPVGDVVVEGSHTVTRNAQGAGNGVQGSGDEAKAGVGAVQGPQVNLPGGTSANGGATTGIQITADTVSHLVWFRIVEGIVGFLLAIAAVVGLRYGLDVKDAVLQLAAAGGMVMAAFVPGVAAIVYPVLVAGYSVVHAWTAWGKLGLSTKVAALLSHPTVAAGVAQATATRPPAPSSAAAAAVLKTAGLT